MVALFVVVTVMTGALTVVALNSFLMTQLDDSVRASAMREGRPAPDGDRPERRPGGGGSFLTLVLENGAVEYNYVAHDSEVTQLSAQQVDQLEAAQLGQDPKTVDLGGSLGDYRLLACAPLTDARSSAACPSPTSRTRWTGCSRSSQAAPWSGWWPQAWAGCGSCAATWPRSSAWRRPRPGWRT